MCPFISKATWARKEMVKKRKRKVNVSWWSWPGFLLVVKVGPVSIVRSLFLILHGSQSAKCIELQQETFSVSVDHRKSHKRATSHNHNCSPHTDKYLNHLNHIWNQHSCVFCCGLGRMLPKRHQIKTIVPEWLYETFERKKAITQQRNRPQEPYFISLSQTFVAARSTEIFITHSFFRVANLDWKSNTLAY